MHANNQLPPYNAAISCNLFAYSYNVYGTIRISRPSRSVRNAAQGVSQDTTELCA